MTLLLVAIGGFFGAVSRFGISQWIKKKYSPHFPTATLLVNLIGAFLLGVLVGAGVGTGWKSLLETGFMGAFTTFSTFKVETIELFRQGASQKAIYHLVVTYLGGILLAFFGMMVGIACRL